MKKQKTVTRRYPKGTHPTFDKVYDRLLLTSGITNEKEPTFETAYMQDPASYEHTLQVTKIRRAELKTQLDEKLKLRQQAIDKYLLMGYDEETAQSKAPGLDTILELEARFDFTIIEINSLQRKIDKRDAEKEQKRKAKILPYGPLGGRWGSPPREVDGQICGLVGKILCITDNESPYKGMSIADYMEKVAIPWQRGGTKPEYMKKGLVSPKCKKEDLPAWPEGVKNYLKPEKEVETENIK